MSDWIKDGIAHGPDALVAGLEKIVGQPLSEHWKQGLHQADLEAWLVMAEQPRPNLESMLGTLRMPCCLYAGEADSPFEQMKAASKQIPNACFFSLPGLNHIQALYESSKVLPRVMEFLAAHR